jgi:hypothetical protein
MRKLGISEILAKADAAQTKKDKIKILQENDSKQLRWIIQAALDSDIIFLLPKGPLKYTPNDFVDQENILYIEARKLYLFVKDGHATLTQLKREALFRTFLENLAPADAELMLKVKDKEWPYKTITPSLLEKAYPGILYKERPQVPYI